MRKTCLIALRNYAACALLLGTTILTGCHKKVAGPGENSLQVEEIANTNDPAQPVITVPTDKILLPTKPSFNFVFDWEQATEMPVPPGQPAVPMPWSHNAIRNYDPGLRYDFKKIDGWELLYCSFSDSINFASRIFILYNKFRGLVRYYTYNHRFVSSDISAARWLSNELTYEMVGNTSQATNFAGQDIVDIGTVMPYASLIDPWQIQENGWYITQFELAYDNNYLNYPLGKHRFTVGVNFVRLTDVVLNGVAATDKIVSLQAPGWNFISFWTRASKLESPNMQLNIKSAVGFDQLSGIFPQTVITNLKQATNSGQAGNILSATLIPGTDIINCRIGVAGSVSWQFGQVGYVNTNVALPGPDNSTVIGLGPVFNEPMGIFYLVSKPVIRYKKESGTLSETYSLDVSSVNYIINPFVKNYADVENFKQEIVALDEKETKNITEARMYAGKILKASKPLKILGIRVSFDVTPKNGSKPIKLIKTFKAAIETS
jgi:hypothetical protein